MADGTGIEWADATWQPTMGCQVVSPGCRNCYAMKMAYRLAAMGQPDYAGLTQQTKAGAVWSGMVRRSSDAVLRQPLRWKRPRRIFVDSMADLFAEAVEDAWIDRAFAVMALCPQHTFLVLTKRAERMRDYIGSRGHFMALGDVIAEILFARRDVDIRAVSLDYPSWPLRNVWAGVSVEDQTRAAERIPHLVAMPASRRFLSCEPLLGPLDLTAILRTKAEGFMRPLDGRFNAIDLVIVGGESGSGARPCWVPNVRSIVSQCQRAKVAVFVKQLGANVRDRNDAGFDGCDDDSWPDMDPFDIEHDLDGTLDGYQGAPVRVRLKDRKGGTMKEWPPDLRVREMPAP